MARTAPTTSSPTRRAAELPPLSEAKLAPPRLRSDLVDRGRVMRALDAAENAALTLVAAPAGYGKTTAVRVWCAGRDAAVAWVTLDAGDNDPVRLWAYIATAVDRIREGLGRAALHRLRLPGTSLDAVIDDLMNGVAAFPREMIVVLDELESVTDAAALGSLESAVARLPSNARLVLVTRSDPALALARQRVRGELAEVRATDLAFTPSETRALVQARAGVRLGDAELELLVQRTEGWPAALELVALSLRDAEDPGEVVRELTGDHRFVADFLSEEVLGALDDDTREFLLRASVLGRFTPQLCDGVLGRTDSAAVIAALEGSSLFVSRLERGGWYRVHPLFAEFAGLRLASESPGTATAVHEAAAEWLLEHGLPAEAATHAAAAGDERLIAQLLVQYHLALLRTGGAGALLHWAESLSDDQFLEHPELAGAAATAAAMIGHRTLERRRFLWLVERSAAERPEHSTPYSRAIAEMARASSLDGRIEDAVESGRRAVELAEQGADEVLVAALGGYARALYFAGDLDRAWQAAMRAVEHPDVEHRAPGHAFARSTLALVAVDRGRLESAGVHADRARAVMGGVGTSRSWLGANASAAFGLLHLAGGMLAEAERELASAEHFFRDEVATVHHAWLLVLLARARCRRGRLDAAGLALDGAVQEIEELGGGPPSVAALAAAVGEELATARDRAGNGDLGEQPSRAELAVLRLLASDLSTRQIGAQLYLSPNTVRSHTRAIYRKLGVNARADAVARAEALGLLADSDSPR
ncbi:MAG: LuxR C-terminal-related transcriptional regulator [Gaiella sp.]|nr:LuxR C-terminal-related transcriptional regulator [Gaiella sp.]